MFKKNTLFHNSLFSEKHVTFCFTFSSRCKTGTFLYGMCTRAIRCCRVPTYTDFQLCNEQWTFPLKTSETQGFLDVFLGHGRGWLAWNGLKNVWYIQNIHQGIWMITACKVVTTFHSVLYIERPFCATCIMATTYCKSLVERAFCYKNNVARKRRPSKFR